MSKRTSLCSHGGTVLSVMVSVFLSIHTVNPAMAFYDHLYTKLLLGIIALLLAVDALLLFRRQRLPLPLAIAFWLLCLLQEGTALCALLFESFPLYTDAVGQATAWLTCLSCITLSLLLRFFPSKKV